jgi:hypothetical protein
MLMKPTGNLDEVMAELRQEHRAVEAPAHLERLLSAAAEGNATLVRSVPRSRIRAWGLGAALAALVVLGLAAWEMYRIRPASNRQAQVVHPVAPAPEPSTQSKTADRALPKQTGPKQTEESSAIKHPRTRPLKGDSGPALQQVSLKDFVPLPASEGLPPMSAISLVRMPIEQSALQQYGFEVPAEAAPRILLAEFVVGDDGLPRAIRIIP